MVNPEEWKLVQAGARETEVGRGKVKATDLQGSAKRGECCEGIGPGKTARELGEPEGEPVWRTEEGVSDVSKVGGRGGECEVLGAGRRRI